MKLFDLSSFLTGNVGKDFCNCCDVCLKQEGEICGGGVNWHFGKCDHNVQYCLKLKGSSTRKCTSLKTGWFGFYSFRVHDHHDLLLRCYTETI